MAQSLDTNIRLRVSREEGEVTLGIDVGIENKGEGQQRGRPGWRCLWGAGSERGIWRASPITRSASAELILPRGRCHYETDGECVQVDLKEMVVGKRKRLWFWKTNIGFHQFPV